MLKTMLEHTPDGLYCAAADVWIDPWRPVARAVITHGHSDHARSGMGSYLCAHEGLGVLRSRLGSEAKLQGLNYGEVLRLGRAELSLHPAGHLLGSAQVRLAVDGQVWVISGDYRVDVDRTATAFAPVPCHVFVTESTFGLPLYRWRPQTEIAREIAEWWAANAAAGRASVLAAYSLGKAQRVLAALQDHGMAGEIVVHGAVAAINAVYAEAGIALPPCVSADAVVDRQRCLVVCPPSAVGSPWIRRFGDASTAMVSGWMQVRGQRRRRGFERGFVLSDHADWPGLLQAIAATGASRVLVTHGQVPTLVRWLRDQGLEAEALATAFGEEDDA